MYFQWPPLLGSHEGRGCAHTHTPELRRGGERLVLSDREHQQEALAAAEVVVPDGCIVLLARRVQDVDLDILAIQHHLFPVAVGLGGLVVLHKLRGEIGSGSSRRAAEVEGFFLWEV